MFITLRPTQSVVVRPLQVVVLDSQEAHTAPECSPILRRSRGAALAITPFVRSPAAHSKKIGTTK